MLTKFVSGLVSRSSHKELLVRVLHLSDLVCNVDLTLHVISFLSHVRVLTFNSQVVLE